MSQLIVVKIVVADPVDVLDTFNKIKVYRAPTINGTYIEVSTSLTRVTLEPQTVSYEFHDPSSEPSYYYKIAFWNSTTGAESGLSEPIQGDQDPALKILSVDELKINYLFGIDLTRDDGEPYPDSLFEFYIKGAVSYVERYLDVSLRGIEYDEHHDYYPSDFDSWILIQLDHSPVLAISDVWLLNPNGSPAHRFDDEWVRLQKNSGQVNIVPTGGAGITMLGASGFLYPRFRAAKFLPDALRVKYTAGLAEIPDAVRTVIGLIAAYGPLNIAGDLVAGAGLAAASLSIDGLSQSITTSNSSTNAGYGARLLEYAKQVKQMLPELRRSLKGVRMVIG